MDTFNIKHILVPLDFSESSVNALDTAVAMAKRQSAKLTLLHVINQNLVSYGHFDVLPTIPPMLEILREESEEILGQMIDKLKDDNNIEISTKTMYGMVASEICNAAEDSEVDLVVMGTHGSSGFREFFMGSNAYSVVKFAPCPVLTIPSNGKWESFSKILFPVRDTPDALQKYDYLRKIIRQNKAVLHVIGLPGTDSASSIDWIARNIQELKSKLREDDVECLTRQLKPTDRIAEEVLKCAEKEHIDLIAITATLDYGIRDFFIGPYTQQIVNHAKVPVLSIRPTPRPNSEQNLIRVIRDDYGPIFHDFSLPMRANVL